MIQRHLHKTLALLIILFSVLSSLQAQTFITRTDTFRYSGSIVRWAVPQGVTRLTITARGAEGGHDYNRMPGKGASIKGDVAVTPGMVLKILAGGTPLQTDPLKGDLSGGGGSFVTDTLNQPIMIAGGGGGWGYENDQGAARDGQTGTTGGSGSGLRGGSGGTNGNGGKTGDGSGGGGGLRTDGGSSEGGKAFVNGGNGGVSFYGYMGGFGGGGASLIYGIGGGGGGYSGGGGGGGNSYIPGTGGGGGSFNGGTNQTNTAGVNTGDGSITITYEVTLAIACSQDTTVYSGAGSCGASVNYKAPTFQGGTFTQTVSDTFNFTGAKQSFVVPAGVSSVSIQAWGAQGGDNNACKNNSGGLGGYSKGDLAVSASDRLYFFVGEQPGLGTFDIGNPGGYNGGGGHGSGGGGGGGASDVRKGDTLLSSRVLVAGAGGGNGVGGDDCGAGGVGGGLQGGNGASTSYTYTSPSINFSINFFGASGGTQTADGQGGTQTSGGQGGYSPGIYSSGGGGGYYGGGGADNAGAGGGSGYIGGVTNGTTTAGVRYGDGLVIITYTQPITYTLTQVSGLPTGSTFPLGATANKYVLSQGSTPLDSCTVTVTVKDTIKPVITACAPSQKAYGCSAPVPDFTSSVQASDNCSSHLTITQQPTAGTVAGIGSTPVLITVTDSSGNAATCSTSFAVADTTRPVLTVPANLLVSNTTGKCYAALSSPGSASAADNCSSPVTLSSNAPSNGQYPVGVTTITYTAKDSSGNVATASQTVTVTDSENPAISCPAAQSFCYSSTGTYTIPALTASDNCGIQSTAYTITGATQRSGSGSNAGGTFAPGVSTIAWTVTDIHNNVSQCQTTVTVNKQILVSIPDASAPSKGVCSNTVYGGYSPASSLTLTAQPSGGSGSYTYLWSTGAKTQSIKVSPTVTTTFTVTITDGSGCTAKASKTVTFVNISCSGNKVTICHYASNTLCISSGDVQSHLNHGDYLGACNNNNCSAIASSARYASAGEKESTASAANTVVYPNPNQGQFSLLLSAGKTGKTEVMVSSPAGSLIERRQVETNGQAQTLSFNLKGKASGIYLIKIISNNTAEVVKVVVQR